jgi:exopolyphosphatase/guanosine-5'-triphosphate,3'-diphosphate pyrophosphatase
MLLARMPAFARSALARPDGSRAAAESTGVSKSRNGGYPPGEAAARKKRKKRRPHRKAQGVNPPGAVLEAPSGAHAPPERRATGEQPRLAQQFRDVVANAPSVRPPGEAGSKSSRKRKRRGRNGQQQAGATGAERVHATVGLAQGSPAATPEHGSNGQPPVQARPAGAPKRRRRKRGKANPPNGEAATRYLRAPVRPAPVPSFDASRVAGRSSAAGDAAAPASPQQTARKHHRRPVFAALDLGTNNCRLLLAAPDGPERFRVVDAYSRIVRLGEGLAATGRLSPDAMQRAIEALAICASKLSGHSIAGKRLIATEACRAAENGQEFLDAVREQTGLELEIVDRETEARLAAEGCGSLMDPKAEGAVLFDIGGGSTELILVRRNKGGSRISGQIDGWTSLPLGVVNLSERHGGRVVSAAAFDGMVNEVREHLHRFEARSRLDDIWHGGRTHLLGTSGTVTTIAGVHLELPRYDRRKVDGIWLSEAEIESVIGNLVAMDYEARARNPCIGRERADLVLAGCAILQAIRLTWPSPRLRVADRGLREGILNDLMHAAGVWRRGHRGGGWDRPRRRAGNEGQAATEGEA